MKTTNTFLKCRVCACALDANVAYYDILELPILAKKFTCCTGLKVSEDDDCVPSKLCRQCQQQLEELHEFRQKCIAADAQWRLDSKENKVSTQSAEETRIEEQQCDSVGVTEIGYTTELTKVAVEEECVENKQIRAKKRVRTIGVGVTKTDSTTELVKVADEEEESKDNILNNEEDSSTSKTTTSYKCDLCNVRFLVEHRLLAHKRQHDGLMPYPCTEDGCERAFNRQHCLSEHVKQHEGTSRWFSCEQQDCNKRYRHKPTLMMHMRRCHKLGPQLKSHVCEFCGKVFSSSAVLNDHRYTHKDKSELPLACPESDCPRRFSSKEKLKVHLLRHAGIKNFSCPYCGMRKTTRNELKIHMNYHTLERTWPCRFCSKVCNSSGNLKMHVRTVHERARDYACSYCDRSFAKPDTRKYHEMTHTGEKPHECGECGKRFTQPAALRTHRKIHERQRKELTDIPTVYTVLVTSEAERSAS